MMSEVARTFEGLGLTIYDIQYVAQHAGLLERIFDSVVDDFYEHLWATGADVALRGVDLDRLRRSQKAHWMRLFSEGIDDRYARAVMRIGVTHKERGLSVRAYTEAYGWLMARVLGEIAAADTIRSAERGRLVNAVTKLIVLDMTLSVRAYDVALID